jgi:hypothetical protein
MGREDIHSFCEALSIKDPIVLGHSFAAAMNFVKEFDFTRINLPHRSLPFAPLQLG